MLHAKTQIRCGIRLMMREDISLRTITIGATNNDDSDNDNDLSARQFFSNITYLRRPGPAKQMFCFREPKFG